MSGLPMGSRGRRGRKPEPGRALTRQRPVGTIDHSRRCAVAIYPARGEHDTRPPNPHGSLGIYLRQDARSHSSSVGAVLCAISPIDEIASAIFGGASDGRRQDRHRPKPDCFCSSPLARRRPGVTIGSTGRTAGSILRGADPGPCRLQIPRRSLVSRFRVVPTFNAGGVERARRPFDVPPGALNIARRSPVSRCRFRLCSRRDVIDPAALLRYSGVLRLDVGLAASRGLSGRQMTCADAAP